MLKTLFLFPIIIVMILSCSESNPTETEIIKCNWFLDNSGTYEVCYYVNSYPDTLEHTATEFRCIHITVYPDDGFYILVFPPPEQFPGAYGTEEKKELPSSYSYEELE